MVPVVNIVIPRVMVMPDCPFFPGGLWELMISLKPFCSFLLAVPLLIREARS